MHHIESKIVRSADEVQRAHDILEAIVHDEMPVETNDETRAYMRCCLNVLCWLLGHDNNPDFCDKMASLERTLADAGLKLTKLPSPMTPEEQARWDAEQN